MKFDHTKIKFGPHVQEYIHTESGSSVTLLGITRVGARDVLVGTTITPGERPWLNVWELDGVCGISANLNLVMTGPKRKLKGWLTIYPSSPVIIQFWSSREEALRNGGYPAACIEHEIEYVEGEGL